MLRKRSRTETINPGVGRNQKALQSGLRMMPECPKPKRIPKPGPPKRKKDIPKASRDAVRERSGGLCEVRLPGCQRIGHHLHHKKFRSAGGSHSPENLISVCNFCHEAIHDHKPGTSRFRTRRWAQEGIGEDETG